jgi:hypothetical protein
MNITPGLAFMNIAGTLVFLALAILGWGGFAAFFSHPPLATVAAATLVMAGVGLSAAPISALASARLVATAGSSSPSL